MTDFRSSITLDVELEGAAAAQRELDNLGDDLTISPELDRRAARQVRQELQSVIGREEYDLRFDIEIPTREIEGRIERINRELDELNRIDADPLATIERRAAAIERSGDLQNLRDDLEALDRSEATVRVDSRQIQRAERQLDDIPRVLRTRVDVDDSDIQEAERAINRLRGGFGGIGRGIVAGVGALGIGFGISEITQEIGRAVSASRDLATAAGLVDRVYGNIAFQARQFGESSAEAFGISERAALEYQGRLGQLIQQQGVARDDALEFSQAYIQVAADLSAATPGSSTEEAIQAIGAAARGEFDSLEQFSIKINQSTVNARALEIQQQSNGRISAQAAQAQALYAEILERSAFAQGSFADAVENGDGAIAIAQANLADIRAEIGTQLLPVVVDLARTFNEDVVPAITEFGPAVVDAAADAVDFIESLIVIGEAAGEAVGQVDRLIQSATGLGAEFNGIAGIQVQQVGLGDLAPIQNIRNNRDEFLALGNSADGLTKELAEVNEEAEKVERTFFDLAQSQSDFDRRVQETTRAQERSNEAFRDAARIYGEQSTAAEAAADATDLLAQALADGTLSAEELADVSDRTNLGVERLTELLPDAEAALEAETAAIRAQAEELAALEAGYADTLLGITSASQQLGEDAGLADFLQGQRDQIEEQAAFFDNLDTLFEGGFDNIAAAIIGDLESGEIDIAAAASIAADAVETPFEDLQIQETLQEELDAADAVLADRSLDIAALFGAVDGEGDNGPAIGFAEQTAQTVIDTFGQQFADANLGEDVLASITDGIGETEIDAGPIGEQIVSSTNTAINDAAGDLDLGAPFNEVIGDVELDFAPVEESFTANNEALTEIIAELDLAVAFQDEIDLISLDFADVESEAQAGGVAVGQAIGDGMRQGLALATNRVAFQARLLARAAANAIRAELGISSPSKVTRGLGRDTGDGFALGLLDRVNSVASAASRNADVAAAALAAPGSLGNAAAGTNVTNITNNTFGDINANGVQVPAGTPSDVAGRTYGVAIRRSIARRN